MTRRPSTGLPSRRNRRRRGELSARTSPCSAPGAPDGVCGDAGNARSRRRFLADQAAAGVRPPTLGRRVAAIAYAHDLAGMASPAAAKLVRVVLGGVRRVKGAKPARKAPATAECYQMLGAISDNAAGETRRALLALGFAGPFRRSGLVALEAADLAFEPDGLLVQIRRSKTDPDGQGQEIANAGGADRGRKLSWSIDRHGRIGAALIAQSVALIVKQRVQAAGLDLCEFAGHSLRAGLLTSAAESGAGVLRTMKMSRHKRVETVHGYVRRANLFKGHAGTAFL